ncbi:MAG: hypothetical protein NC115_05280 [Bacteroidales bacterium]|nr:hypothetical protein [Bacteroidales bacterium]
MGTIQERETFLTSYMLKYCTDLGFLAGTLLNSEDIDSRWQDIAPEFCAEAVREFNSYPEFCLACAGFLGMAVAGLWDIDWERYSTRDYAFYKGPGGFDTMDEHILWKLLNLPKGSPDEQAAVKKMQSCSTEMYHLLGKSSVERGTADAYRLFLSAMTVMFKTGEAIELYKLGYKFEKLEPFQA